MTFYGIELLLGILGAALVSGAICYCFGRERGIEEGWKQCREEE